MTLLSFRTLLCCMQVMCPSFPWYRTHCSLEVRGKGRENKGLCHMAPRLPQPNDNIGSNAGHGDCEFTHMKVNVSPEK